MKSFVKIGLMAGLIGASLANYAQVATPEQMGAYANKEGFATFHMQTKLGSFKFIDAEGRADVSFSGTLLITKHTDGEFRIVEGKLRKEYDKNGRTVYTGKGRVIVTGKWRGLQWFGSDMTSVFYGHGFVRLTGEFDRNLKTGDYWFDDTEKMAFPSSNVMSLPIPPTNYGADKTLTPKPRIGGTAGGGN
jgi:hypothetical protein